MNSPKDVDPTKIAIQKVSIVKAIIDQPDEFALADIKGFKTDVSFNTAFNLEDKLAKTDLDLNIETDSAGLAPAICNYNIQFIFHISNLHELAEVVNGTLTINKPLHAVLASVSYSTARGLLLDRLKNTAFQEFILPIISTNNMING